MESHSPDPLFANSIVMPRIAGQLDDGTPFGVGYKSTHSVDMHSRALTWQKGSHDGISRAGPLLSRPVLLTDSARSATLGYRCTATSVLRPQ